MSKRNEFNTEEMLGNPDIGYDGFSPMFSYPEDDIYDMRSCCYPAMQPYMMPGMQYGYGMMPMMNQMNPYNMPGGANNMGMGKYDVVTDTTSTIEPGLQPGLQSGTLPGLGINPETSQQQATVFNQGFLQNYLARNIGKQVRIEFLIGTNIVTDRSGIIDEVGTNYVVLRDPAGGKVVCDLYSIKFINTYV